MTNIIEFTYLHSFSKYLRRKFYDKIFHMPSLQGTLGYHATLDHHIDRKSNRWSPKSNFFPEYFGWIYFKSSLLEIIHPRCSLGQPHLQLLFFLQLVYPNKVSYLFMSNICISIFSFYSRRFLSFLV